MTSLLDAVRIILINEVPSDEAWRDLEIAYDAAMAQSEASCHRCEGRGWIDNSHDQADPHARPTCSCCAGTGKERHR